MKIFHTNAEKYLEDIMSGLRESHTAWRAHVFHFSTLKPINQNKELEKVLSSLVADKFLSNEGYVFFCGDDDVIVLLKAVGHKALLELGAEVEKRAFPSTWVTVDNSWRPIYDLSIQWNQFNQVCDAKLEAVGKLLDQKALEAARKTTERATIADLPEDALQRLVRKGLEERQERKRPLILMVEDDQVSLHLARKALEGVFTIETAINAAEARSSYLTHMPDVVFLDIELPDSSGHNLIGEFMAMDPDAYIVMLSGNSFQNDILKAMRLGAKGFVGKPFTRAKLLHYVNQSPHCRFPFLHSTTA